MEAERNAYAQHAAGVTGGGRATADVHMTSTTSATAADMQSTLTQIRNATL